MICRCFVFCFQILNWDLCCFSELFKIWKIGLTTADNVYTLVLHAGVCVIIKGFCACAKIKSGCR